MIEEFFRATDWDGACWEYPTEPKWVFGFWHGDEHTRRPYHGTNKPEPGKCETRYSLPGGCRISDIASMEYKLLEKEKEVNELRALLNNAKIRAADLESENKMLKQHRESDKKDFMDQRKSLSEAEARVQGLESANKELQVQLETFKNDPNLRDLYFHMKSICVPGSYIEGVLKRLNEKFNFEGFKIEKDGIYETECGKKVYVFLQEGVYWQCYSPHFGHQVVTESGSCMGGKIQLVKRIGDL
jgi:hypothetical protein